MRSNLTLGILTGYFVLSLSACNQPVRTVIPENTPAATPIICPEETATAGTASTWMSRIPEQSTFMGRPFAPLPLADFLHSTYDLAEQTWKQAGSEHLDIKIEQEQISATIKDANWHGSETVHLEVCDPSGICAAQDVVYTLLPDEALKITYTCNEGFIIETREKKVLIDALFWGKPPVCSSMMAGKLDAMRQALPPFDNADLVLSTHQHGDHYYIYAVGDYLKNNPRAVLVTNNYADLAMRLYYEEHEVFASRVRVMDLQPGQKEQLTVQDIDLTVLPTSQENHSLGFVISMGGYTLFHAGDAGSGPAMVDYYQTLGLPDQKIDIAFIPWWNMLDHQEYSYVEQGIKAGMYIPMHLETGQSCYSQQILIRGSPGSYFFPGNAKLVDAEID